MAIDTLEKLIISIYFIIITNWHTLNPDTGPPMNLTKLFFYQKQEKKKKVYVIIRLYFENKFIINDMTFFQNINWEILFQLKSAATGTYFLEIY